MKRNRETNKGEDTKKTSVSSKVGINVKEVKDKVSDTSEVVVENLKKTKKKEKANNALENFGLSRVEERKLSKKSMLKTSTLAKFLPNAHSTSDSPRVATRMCCLANNSNSST